jgi:hypothetical protein
MTFRYLTQHPASAPSIGWRVALAQIIHADRSLV